MQKKEAMFSLWIVFVSTLICQNVDAKPEKYIKEYSYQANEADSKSTCQIIAFERMKRLLLEELGTYIESITVANKHQITKDQITTISAGIISVETIEERWDGKNYWLKAQLVADPLDVKRQVELLKNDRENMIILEELRNKNDESSQIIKKLGEEIVSLRGQQKSEVLSEYLEAVSVLYSSEWFYRGFALSLKKQYFEAISAYTRSIEYYPMSINAYYNRAHDYNSIGSHENALRDYSKVLELDSEHVSALTNRAKVHYDMHNYQAALRDANRAITLDPRHATAYGNRGHAYYYMGKYEDAVSDYSKVIELDPMLVTAYIGRAEAYKRLGKLELSHKDYSKAIEIDPKNSMTYSYRSGYYNEIGNYQQAINDANKAAKLNPRNYDAFLFLGNAYYMQKKYREAILNYEKAIEINPLAASAYNNRSLSFAGSGDNKSACYDAKKACELGECKARTQLVKQGYCR